MIADLVRDVLNFCPECGPNVDSDEHGYCKSCGATCEVRDRALERLRAFLSSTPTSAPGGVDLIAAERRRQIESERWSADHDDIHRHGELAIVAAQLLVAPTDEELSERAIVADLWGLLKKHRGDRIRQLVIAGALVAAEIDRVLRMNTEGSL